MNAGEIKWQRSQVVLRFSDCGLVVGLERGCSGFRDHVDSLHHGPRKLAGRMMMERCVGNIILFPDSIGVVPIPILDCPKLER
jgi:hypothetical protein